jgi:two-component system, NarL family, sensor histidine kinase DegS
MSGPYTPKSMEAASAGSDALDSRFDGLQAEASAAVGYSANTLRSVRERYREALAESRSRWQALRDELESTDRRAPDARPRAVTDDADADAEAASAAEAGADDARRRTLRRDVEMLGNELGAQGATLERLELAERTLSRVWLFLERGDASLVTTPAADVADDDMRMRIIEAQEAERSRLAQEIHDGPAQALANAIFQAEYIERIAPTDPTAAATETRTLRELLRRELANVRDFINQLQPPLLGELGLDGAIEESVERSRTTGAPTITTDLTAPADELDDRQRTVVLRVTQEALQNVRKHAGASMVVVSTTVVDDDWTLEVRDDGRGFDTGAVAARGHRNFGLQFMRERAELIGARFDVRSRADGGTVVRLAIPRGARAGAKENG